MPVLRDFFSKYLLSSVESIVHDIIGNKKEFLCQKIREHYVSKHDRRLFPKIQEFVYYSTASEFIKIMLHYKENPIFREDNIHTTLIQLDTFCHHFLYNDIETISVDSISVVIVMYLQITNFIKYFFKSKSNF